MSFAEELREQTVTDEQRATARNQSILRDKDRYVRSFRYACRGAARRGKRSCTLVFQNNYDDNICNFYTEDFAVAKEIASYAEEQLEKDGFKKLAVSVEKIASSRTVERTVFKSLLGRYAQKRETYYTLRIEAKW